MSEKRSESPDAVPQNKAPIIRVHSALEASHPRNEKSHEAAHGVSHPDAARRFSAVDARSPLRSRTVDAPEVTVVALTGGPCAGKSTALARLGEQLSSMGYHVYMVPEAATILLQGGARIHPDRERFLSFEKTLIETQMALEDRFKDLAQALPEKSIIICDRGVMDNKAYVNEDLWEALMDENGWSAVQLRDRRYDGVIHMVTAAQGAEKFYTLSNNTARTETVEQAREVDSKVLQAWVGHPRHRIVANTTTFEDKITRVVQELCEIVGAPLPGSAERRFLLKTLPSDSEYPSPLQVFDVTIDYLPVEGGLLTRLKKRTQLGASKYTVSQRRIGSDFIQNGSPREAATPLEIANADRSGELVSEYQVTARDYLNLLDERAPSNPTVKKRQKVFTYHHHIWLVNEYLSPVTFAVLEVHVTDQKVVVPPFFQVEREVSNDPAYSSAGVALRLRAEKSEGV